MLAQTLIALSLLVLSTITDQESSSVFAYQVPRRVSRPPECGNSLSTTFSFHQKRDGDRHATPLRVSRINNAPDIQEENAYYTGDEESILGAYEQWRIRYAKGDYDHSRYQNFRANYIGLMTTNAAEMTVARDMGCPDPVPLALDEYGDLPPDEFDNLRNNPGTSQAAEAGSGEGYAYPQTTSSGAQKNSAATNEQDRIRQVYNEWCFMNGKEYDESRLEIFDKNLRVVENYQLETGEKAELNEYADLSPDEFMAIARSSEETSANHPSSQHRHAHSLNNNMPTNNNGQMPRSTLDQYYDESEVERLRQAYLEWCGFNGKDYIDSRLDNFAVNLIAVENYRAETGENAILNAYADMSITQYNTMAFNSTEAQTINGNFFMEILSGTGPTGYGTDHHQDATGMHSSASDERSPFSESSSVISPTVLDQGVRAVYHDWCEYYEKAPTADGLRHFTKKYSAVEQHFRETGEELTLNENADLSESEISTLQEEQARAEEAAAEADRLERGKIQAEEEARLREEVAAAAAAEEEFDRLKRAENERMEKAHRNEEQRRKNEADLLQKEENERIELARRNEEQRMKKEESERTEQARRNEEEQKKAEELVRMEKERKLREEEIQRQKEEEERALFEEARRRVEDAQLLEQKEAAEAAQVALEERKADAALAASQDFSGIHVDQSLLDLEAEKDRLRQERIRLEESLKADRARLKEERQRETEARIALEETNRRLDKMLKEDEEEITEKSDPIILPRASYMDAVAKTWVDRSAYLEALQEGRAGALPNNPELTQRRAKAEAEHNKRTKIEQSESLIDSIWNFMKEDKMDGMSRTNTYSTNLIRQADKLIEVCKMNLQRLWFTRMNF